MNLLNQVLGIVIGVCLEHQSKAGDFDQMPFQRIFIMLFYELCAPEAILESINWHTLQAFTNAYHYLRPIKGIFLKLIIIRISSRSKKKSISLLKIFHVDFTSLKRFSAPGFVYAWIELIGYRTFVMRMMQHTPDQKGWPMYAQVLDLIFIELA